MYANTQNTQATAERGVPRTHIAPPVDGGSLGIYTKSLVAPSKRVHDFILQDQSCKLLPKHRVCNCLKKRIDKNKNRTVKYNVDRKKSHWSNVQRCASLWVCPVCAKQITEGRRSELSAALERWKKEFLGGCLLLTLTFSHSLDMPLAVTQLGLRKAYQYFVEHRQVKNIFEFLGVQHKIKGQEITWGGKWVASSQSHFVIHSTRCTWFCLLS